VRLVGCLKRIPVLYNTYVSTVRIGDSELVWHTYRTRDFLFQHHCSVS